MLAIKDIRNSGVKETSIVKDFNAESVNNNSYGIDMIDEYKNILRIMNDKTLQYIPNIKSNNSEKVYNTALDYGMSKQIVSTKSEIKMLSDDVIAKINSVGGVRLVDNTSFIIGEGVNIDRSFISMFNRNIRKMNMSTVPKPVAKGTKKGTSFRSNDSIISVIISPDLLNSVKSTKVVKNILGLIVSDRSVMELMSNPIELKEISDELGVKYSSLSNLKQGMISEFDSSYGSITPGIPNSGVGVFEKVNNNRHIRMSKADLMKETISIVSERSDINVSITFNI